MSALNSSLKRILQKACDLEASDIHFYPFKEKVTIYFRIHGQRVKHLIINLSTYQQLLAYLKFTSGMDIGEVRKPQDGIFAYFYKNKEYSLRLSTLPILNTESLAIRILPQEDHLSLDRLFLFPNQLNKIKSILSNTSGLILITGATGSGKTTTLYALLEALSKRQAYQVVTLEDPIEKQVDNILQVQINERSGITYQTSLKATLRHDPDIIMIGEIRDANVAHFSHRAALTGHLVFSTLHAKNSLGTLHRLLDMGLTKVELQQSLKAIISLELLPISVNGQPTRRAAIFEMLDENMINAILEGSDITIEQNQTFEHLRKKAYVYGFIDQKTYENFISSTNQ